MKSAVIVFPGSNCDRDAAVALERVTGQRPSMVWHKDTSLPDRVDLVVLPGGFSYGDYLRCGAMAARSPIMRAVVAHAARGARVLGVCNGFQILCETALLPGALLRNAGLKFVCRETTLQIANANTPFTAAYGSTRETVIPVAHADGRFTADAETIAQLDGDGLVTLRYVDNPNGSMNNIAGVINAAGTVMGMMPHPERVCDPSLDRLGGWAIFQSLADAA
jgi:phosphoribosylformylglycinamidine synthase subunit PurQ / glutaminase